MRATQYWLLRVFVSPAEEHAMAAYDRSTEKKKILFVAASPEGSPTTGLVIEAWSGVSAGFPIAKGAATLIVAGGAQ
jgi:hypothetical protein